MTPLDNDRHIVGFEENTTSISFDITEADPKVTTSNIQWIFSSTFSNDPYNGIDITNQPGLGNSIFTFSTDKLTLTISNVNQTVEGRYYLIANNPAGVDYNYTDLIVHGKSVN